MKKNPIYILFILIFLLSCQKKNENYKLFNSTQDSSSILQEGISKDYSSEEKSGKEPTERKSFQSYFKADSTMDVGMVRHRINISNKDETVKLAAICNCEKNAKNNTIKIQLTAVMPTGSELEEGITGSRFFSDIGLGNDFKGQFKFLTFHLTDSVISKIQLLSKSIEKEYNGSDFKYSDITKYQVKISKFDYSIASDIYGKYKVILPEPFGYIENDTILEGTFKCNNWRINDFESVKEWDLEKENEAKKKSHGFRINE